MLQTIRNGIFVEEQILYEDLMGNGTFTLEDYDQVLNELRSFWKAMPDEE